MSAHKFTTSDWAASITLPASQDCYSYNVMSGRETRTPAGTYECELEKLRSIRITSENYKLLKRDILNNCQYAQCKQLTGAFDELFLRIDESLQLITPDFEGDFH